MEAHSPSGADSLHSYMSLCCSAVPAAVADITGRADGDALQVSWRRPDGDLDAVVVNVSANGSKLWTTTLAPDTTNVSLGQVTPGTSYLMSVQSRSGQLTNQSEASVRTGGVVSLFFFLLSSRWTLSHGLHFLFRPQCRRQRPSWPSVAPPLPLVGCS